MTRAGITGRQFLLLAVCCYVCFFLGNGILNLTNPDEVFYAQTAKEMIQQRSWLTPFLFGVPQFEKPVLTYWFLRFSLAFFGASSYSLRVFPALFATLGIFAVYLLGMIGFANRRKAFLASLVLLSSGLYIGLARTVFTDMIVTVFIALSLLSFYAAYAKKEYTGVGITLFFVFAGLAVLTKGPLGIALPFLTVLIFLAVNGKMKFILHPRFAWGAALFLLITAPWYIVMIQKYGHAFTREFFYNDHIRRVFEAEHKSNDRGYFYPLAMVACMFPWSIFVCCALVRLFRKIGHKAIPAHPIGPEIGHRQAPFQSFLACWIAVVFLSFQFAHSKLVTYIFPLFPALALVTGDFIGDALGSAKKRGIMRVTIATLLTLACIPPVLAVQKLSKLPWAIGPVRMLGVVIAVFCVVLAGFILRKKLLQSFYMLACVNVLILATALCISRDINPYISSRDVGACLAAYDIRGPIVCSKAFARGVRYYTDKDIAVFERGKNFFSPHPIPFFDSDGALITFLRGRAVTYCVLRKKVAHEVAEMAGKEFKVTTLKVIGDEHVVKIERL